VALSALVDSHCHLDAAEFAADRDAVLARARAAGVVAQIVPAVRLADFAPLRALCAAHADLHPAYGLHPMFLTPQTHAQLPALADWLAREHAVALGECGLDFHVSEPAAQLQRDCFHAQLRLAREFDLPLILHARRAVDEVIATLRRHAPLRGVVHSYSGSAEQARQLWRLGFLIGVGGPLTYERARRLRSLVAGMPLEYLLLETDAPDQPLATHRGERNEPARLREVAQTVAQLRGIEPAEVAAATCANAQRLFTRARLH